MVAGIDRLAGYRSDLRNAKRRSIVAVGDFTRARQLLRLAGGEEIEASLVLPTSLVVRESG